MSHLCGTTLVGGHDKSTKVLNAHTCTLLWEPSQKKPYTKKDIKFWIVFADIPLQFKSQER